MRLDGYKSNAVGALVNHWTRHSGDPEQTKYTYKNVNIDSARTAQNYTLGVRHDEYHAVMDDIRAKVAEADRKPTKSTNVVGSIVITKPKYWPDELSRQFFEAAFAELSDQVGEENVVGAWVHMDETTPHMHFAFVPRTEVAVMENDKSKPLRWTKRDERRNPEHRAGTVKRDKKGTVRYERRQVVDEHGRPVTERRLALSAMFDRARMKGLHDDVATGMTRRLDGTRCPEVSLRLKDDEWVERALSHVPHDALAAAQASIVASASKDARRADERARRRRDAAEREADAAERRAAEAREAAEAAEARRKKAEAEAEQAEGRLERLHGEENRAQDEVRALEAGLEKGGRGREVMARGAAAEAELPELRGRKRALETENRDLRTRLGQLRARLARAGEAVRAAVARLDVTRLPARVADVVTNALLNMEITPPWVEERRVWEIATEEGKDHANRAEMAERDGKLGNSTRQQRPGQGQAQTPAEPGYQGTRWVRQHDRRRRLRI